MLGNDRIPKICLQTAAWGCASLTFGVLVFMAWLSIPVLRASDTVHILTLPWLPGQGQFGIGPMILGSLYISVLSLIMAAPVSFGAAIFIRITRPGTLGKFFQHLVEAMTAIPTVVYGFIGIFLIVPLIRETFVQGSGMCILSAAIMLSLVISPTMILIFSQSISSVPRQYTIAVEAMGATPAQKFLMIILPCAWKGILTGLILGFGRAVGDTLIALMISGNTIDFPRHILDSARTLTAHIALVTAADFDSMEFKTLFVCALTLYLLTCVGVFFARAAGKRQ
ncbi:phosphate ABC transporter membrane protein 1, PhoT family [Desulfocicer vacuolatum DSM 3385]|uniref:Phosphate ABC transporter membrane protein 1, PhoT family n=1 Tax=Desulfocicer vacuolatum DSM 3385 TaxID=1121400 RepID=A0A1W2E6D4_9BACT|nr:ABC transporter permease subunit [Desulfocicer vacuolatum]SMD05304.1 phosphate ABC transporter membrane protein 1, PhoT family [Desulfocicer vacuolatum DSM 3385]